MLRQNKNLDITYLKVTSDTPVSEYKHKDGTIYKNGSIRTNGGIYVEKGIKIGNQEQVCNGMVYYDGENFFGYSEKLGTCLLSNHSLSSELMLPNTIFENIIQEKGNKKKYVITAAQNNLTKTSTQMDIEGEEEKEEILVKNIHVDVVMKDIKTFYIMIPQIYQNTNFHLNLVITFQFDEMSYINDAKLHIINQTHKKVSVEIGNDKRNVYYETDYKNIVEEKNIGTYDIHRIIDSYLCVKSSFYKK